MAQSGHKYEIVEILARKRIKLSTGKTEVTYLVRWKGRKRDTWESVQVVRKAKSNALKEFYTWVNNAGLMGQYSIAKPNAYSSSGVEQRSKSIKLSDNRTKSTSSFVGKAISTKFKTNLNKVSTPQEMGKAKKTRQYKKAARPSNNSNVLIGQVSSNSAMQNVGKSKTTDWQISNCSSTVVLTPVTNASIATSTDTGEKSEKETYFRKTPSSTVDVKNKTEKVGKTTNLGCKIDVKYKKVKASNRVHNSGIKGNTNEEQMQLETIRCNVINSTTKQTIAGDKTKPVKLATITRLGTRSKAKGILGKAKNVKTVDAQKVRAVYNRAHKVLQKRAAKLTDTCSGTVSPSKATPGSSRIGATLTRSTWTLDKQNKQENVNIKQKTVSNKPTNSNKYLNNRSTQMIKRNVGAQILDNGLGIEKPTLTSNACAFTISINSSSNSTGTIQISNNTRGIKATDTLRSHDNITSIVGNKVVNSKRSSNLGVNRIVKTLKSPTDSSDSNKLIVNVKESSSSSSIKMLGNSNNTTTNRKPKSTNKTVKGRVNKRLQEIKEVDDISQSSGSESDTLYSLTDITGTPTKKLKLQLYDVKKSPISSRASTPELDNEISFKLTSPARRLLLKDSLKKKQKYKPAEAEMDSGPSAALPLPSSLTIPTYKQEQDKTPPGTPTQSSTESTPTKTIDDFTSSIPVMPLVHNSPAACYKTLMKNLQNLQADRGMKNKKPGESSGPIERRTSVRQSESVYKYKDIVVKKCSAYTQIWLFSQNKMRNSLNPQVMTELIQALHNAKYDDSRLVMLAGNGSVFCSGIDLNYITSTGDHKKNARKMSESLNEFIQVLISFPKPLVAAVNGSAIGLGCAILPLCDIVYASDKASFYCPYTRLNQTPEGCSSYTFPHVMGSAMANEMLLAGRKITATEACQVGLVSQVFWPDGMMQSVILKLQQMAAHSAKALEASKLLIRSHQKSKLEFTCDSECQLLLERWASPDCIKAQCTYIDKEQDYFL